MKKTFLLFGLLFINIFCLSVSLEANDISFTSKIWTTSDDSTIHDAKKSDKFTKLKKDNYNFGFDSKKTIWLQFELENISNQKITKSLVIDNPLLEKVFFFDSKYNFRVFKSGKLHVNEQRNEIFPSYTLTMEAQEKRLVYVMLKSSMNTLQFGVNILDEKAFKSKDKLKEFFIVLFSGFILAFLFYSIMLYFYTKNSSYILYAFYLCALIFQELSHIGYFSLYLPYNFVYIDNLLFVPKLSLIMLTSALFTQKFLNVKEHISLNKVYKVLIALVALHVPFFGTQFFYIPEITLSFFTILAVLNLGTGIYVYLKGNKQARFFIVGWSFLFIGYILKIVDVSGLFSIMHHFPELLLWLTFLEAMFLLLAFFDEIDVLSREKKDLSQKLLNAMATRQIVVAKEVKQKTKELEIALADKSTLLQEVQHRVKNNLQLILSVTRLQRYDSLDKNSTEQFKKLERRIRSVAKTHELLCTNNDIETVDMQVYIGELCEELVESFTQKYIKIHYDAKITMPLSKAVYVGLIVNELVSNSIKHAFNDNDGEIHVKLFDSEENYHLSISDNGKGYDTLEVRPDSLGLRLVNLLVLNQLNGSLDIKTNDSLHYDIVFPKHL